MAGNKTADGLNIAKLVRMMEGIDGITVRSGTNHDYVANYNNHRPCPIDASTNAKKFVAPWLSMITGYKKAEIYQMMKKGKYKGDKDGQDN